MTSTDDNLKLQADNLRGWLYDRSMTQQLVLSNLLKMLGPIRGQHCLLIHGALSPMADRIQKAGGTWESVTFVPGELSSVAKALVEGKQVGQDLILEWDDNAMDVVVVTDVLENVEDHAKFILECHRVLKPTGRLVVDVPHRKRISLLGMLRALLGLSSHWHGTARAGYSESMLFDLLKDGFDAEEVATYSRFWVQLADTWAKLLTAVMGAGKDVESDHVNQELRGLGKVQQAYSLTYPLGWLGSKLDLLIGFTKGYRLITRARHRPWKPRRTPTLTDGRSIADAAINTKIGTAAPF